MAWSTKVALFFSDAIDIFLEILTNISEVFEFEISPRVLNLRSFGHEFGKNVPSRANLFRSADYIHPKLEQEYTGQIPEEKTNPKFDGNDFVRNMLTVGNITFSIKVEPITDGFL